MWKEKEYRGNISPTVSGYQEDGVNIYVSSGQLFQLLNNKLCYIRVVYNGIDIIRKHSGLSPLEWIHTDKTAPE